MSASHLFDTLCRRIREAYIALGHSLNWSFLYTPAITLSEDQQLFFIGLNPGGGAESGPYDEGPSSEVGNTYLHEDWGYGEGRSPLQLQVQSLYNRFAEQLNRDIDYKQLMDQSLAANYVPFRSPNWKTFIHKTQSLTFADNLWRDVLNFVIPGAIVSIAEIPYHHFVKLLESKGFTIRKNTKEHIGWGNVTFSMTRLELNKKSVIVLRLPHLSTYKIFSRKECESAIGLFISEISEVMNQKAL